MKRRTSSVDERQRSPAPEHVAGLTITTGSPRAAMRSASTSAACLASTYGTPSRRRATAGARRPSPPGGAGPTAATDEVWTTRSTPARSASSSTMRVPSTLTCEQRVGARAQGRQAGDVEDAVDAAQRPAHRARGRARRPATRLDVEAASVVERARSRARSTRTSSPRATSGRATCEPTSPVAPVTRVVGTRRRSLRTRRSGAHGPGRRRHRHDALPAARARRASRPAPGLALRQLRGRRPSARPTCRLRRLLRAPAHRRSCRRPRSRRSATSSPSTSRCSTPAHDIVSIHLSGGISGTSTAPAGARPARRARHRPGAIDRARLGDRLRRARPGGDRRGRGRARRRRTAEVAADARRGARGELKIWFARRHARVPAPRRPGRRRAGVARRGAEDQADPLDRDGDHCRSSACGPPAGVRAHGRVHRSAPRRRRRRVGRPAHPAPPSRRSAWSSAAARSSARARSSSPRSARSSARTSGPACSASAAMPARAARRPAASS